MNKMGSWSFIIGLVIVVLVGLFTEATGWAVTLLVILGIIVGFLNVTVKEETGYLIAAAALIVAGQANLQSIPVLGVYLARILANLVVFVAPAAIVVAIKAIYALSSD